MSKTDSLSTSELIWYRAFEYVLHHFKLIDVDPLPAWVTKTASKIWRGVIPRGFSPPSEKNLDEFLAGLFLAVSQRPGTPPAETPAHVRTAFSSLTERTGTTPFTRLLHDVTIGSVDLEAANVRAEFGEMFTTFLDLDLKKRESFAMGMLLGCKIQNEFESLWVAGASTRRTVYMVLWLHWPKVQEMESVAALYRLLEEKFSGHRCLNLLGDFERFKKLSQDIDLRLPKSRQGKL